MISVNLIVNGYTGGDTWYEKGMKRLRESLKGRTSAEFRTVEWITGYPGRDSRNYSIKTSTMWKFRKECQYMLWLDCSIWAVKNLEPVFDIIRERGYFIMNNPGWNTGQWTSDKALKYFKLTRDEAMTIPHCMSGIIGFDCQKYDWLLYLLNQPEITNNFVGDWTNERKQVSQDERCLGHRHDQSVLSILLRNYEMMEWEDPSKWISFQKPGDGVPDRVYFCGQGM